MFELSLPKLILIALVVLVLFGRGKVADLMGEFGKGVKSFKHGMADEEAARPTAPPSQIAPTPPVSPVASPVVPPAVTPMGTPAVTPMGTPGHDPVNHGQV